MKFIIVLIAVAAVTSGVFAGSTSASRINGDALPVGDVARMLLRTYNSNGQFVVGLCDARNCSIVSINGVLTSNAYNVRPGYHFGFTKSTDILSPVVTVLRQVTGSGWETNQDIVILVQRLSPYVMAIWTEENPSFIITVPVRSTHFSLKIWTNVGIWSFNEEDPHTGMNSTALHVLGSTADKPSRRRLNGDPLGLEEVVGVDVVVTRDKPTNDGKSYAIVALCGRVCSEILVRGINETSPYGYPSIAFNTGYTSTGNEADSIIDRELTEGVGAFKFGQTFNLLVQRLGTNALAVWMKNRPEYVVTIPVARDRLKLRARTQFLGQWKFTGNNNTELIAS